MSGVDFNTGTLNIFYACTALLCLKTLFMALLTAKARHQKKVIISPEDKIFMKNGKLSSNDPDVERARRAHRNDIENIPIFISSGFLYAITNPNPVIAALLFIAYTAARFGHTYVYVIKVTPQPSRWLCFTTGYLINLFMLGNVIHFTWTF